MTGNQRPNPGQLSRAARTRRWRLAVLAAGCGLAVGLLVWAALSGGREVKTAEEARRVAAGEPAPPAETVAPSQQAPEAAPAPAGPTLPQVGTAFVERFDRKDITNRWLFSDGWSNGSWMANDWRRSQAIVTPGLMALQMEKGPKGSAYEMASGEMKTHAAHRYGYFEVRMKVPRGPGLVTGVFTYAGREKKTQPNEIDIEILGKNTRAAELTIHVDGKATSKIVTLPFDAADGFHTYGFDWQPGHVRWYADGALIHAETGAAARSLTRPQQLILDLWGSRELRAWVGDLPRTTGPWRLEFSCIAYAASFTGALCN
jgi:beta-glucanase (GH16 family)